MRFKAKLATDQVSLLYSIAAPLSKLQDPTRQCVVLYLDGEYLRISAKNTVTQMTCFAELDNRTLFLEHRIESAADNVIVCQIDLVSLKLALQSVLESSNPNKKNTTRGAGGAERGSIQTLLVQPKVIMKLAKRNSLPCLCLEGRTFIAEIHQAIPIILMRANEMTHHLPPQIPTPTVQLELPQSRPLRGLVDKLKAIGSILYVEASQRGDLTLRSDQEGASLACFYNDLIPRWDESDDGPNATRDYTSSCTLKIDASKLSSSLQWQQTSLRTTSCLLGMVPNQMMVLHVVLQPAHAGFFTYYIPVYYLDEGEQEPQFA